MGASLAVVGSLIGLFVLVAFVRRARFGTSVAEQLDELWEVLQCKRSLLSCCGGGGVGGKMGGSAGPKSTTQVAMGDFVARELTVVVAKAVGGTKLGLSLCSYAKDNGHPRITELKEGGAAAASGKLFKNDVIVKVNGVAVCDDRAASDAIQRASGDVTFVVHRTVALAPAAAAPDRSDRSSFFTEAKEELPTPTKAALAAASVDALAKQGSELELLRAQNESLSRQMASQAESLAGISTFLTTTVGPALAAEPMRRRRSQQSCTAKPSTNEQTTATAAPLPPAPAAKAASSVETKVAGSEKQGVQADEVDGLALMHVEEAISKVGSSVKHMLDDLTGKPKGAKAPIATESDV